jgi:penicillin-insensitive murein endopeptidase
MVVLPSLGEAPESKSTCYGTPERGRLEGGVALPLDGPNFRAYSRLGSAAGRTYVHAAVRDVVIETYAHLAISNPEIVWVYGETGLRGGGRFAPHRTHQNGTAVDFLVPVRDRDGKPALLPTNVLNKYGYDIEFDERGKTGELAIDFPAVCAHLLQLQEVAGRSGVPIRRVIFAPEFVAALRGTRECDLVRAELPWFKKRPWVRHDEHYHVDFAVRCEPFRPR